MTKPTLIWKDPPPSARGEARVAPARSVPVAHVQLLVELQRNKGKWALWKPNGNTSYNVALQRSADALGVAIETTSRKSSDNKTHDLYVRAK